jgi:hypothetical protein
VTRINERRAGQAGARGAAPNFTPAALNGLAARLRWSVAPKYADANHEPKGSLRGCSRISAREGETVRVEGEPETLHAGDCGILFDSPRAWSRARR